MINIIGLSHTSVARGFSAALECRGPLWSAGRQGRGGCDAVLARLQLLVPARAESGGAGNRYLPRVSRKRKASRKGGRDRKLRELPRVQSE